MPGILFVNPSVPFLDALDFTADSPPLGLLSLAGFLSRHGVESEIIDAGVFPCFEEFFEELGKRLFGREFVGITFQIGMEETVGRIIGFIEKTSPETRIILGGWQATISNTGNSRHLIIKGVNGEAFEKLLKTIKGNNQIVEKNIPVDYNISVFGLNWNNYLYPNYKLETIKAKGIREKALEKEKTRYHIALYLPLTCPAYLSGKGCCFCDIAKKVCLENLSEKVFENKKKLFEEIKQIGELFKGKKATIEFNAEATSFALWKELMQKFAENKLDLHQFCFQTRPDMITEEWIREMKRSGIENIVQIGFEYGNQKELDFVGKGTKLQDYKKLLPKLQGLKIAGFFILTSNISNRETLDANIGFIERFIEKGGQALVNPALIDSNAGGEMFSKPKLIIPKLTVEEKKEILDFLEKKIEEHEKKCGELEEDAWKERSFQSLMGAERELLELLNDYK